MLLSIAARGVPALKTKVAEGEAMIPFRPGRLIIPPTVGPFFEVVDLMITRICFVDGGKEGIPSDVFTWTQCKACGAKESVGGAEIDFGDLIIHPGYKVCLTVRNRDIIAHDFGGVLEGTVAEQFPSDRDLTRHRQRAEVLAEARLYEAVANAITDLKSPKSKWPDSAHKVAGDLQAALVRATGIRQEIL